MNVFEKFVSLTEEKNIPFTVNFELTHWCNLHCIHCYIPQSRINTNLKNRELTRIEIESILDQLAEAGSLWLIFSGGEVFLHEDFFAIARYAQEKRFCLTIFTNATLLTEDKIKQLASLPIYSVQISLYGAKAETHDAITQVRGSFERTIKAVILLKKRKIKVVLKTPLMKNNFAEYKKIIKLNENLGTNWQLDPWITPKNDGNRDPLDLRVNQENLKELFSDENYFPRKKFAPMRKERFLCSAGKNLVALSPYGDVYPCLMWLVKVGNLRKEKFSQIWQESSLLNRLRSIKFKNLKICKTCSLVPYCLRCPGLAELEDGDFLAPSGIACQTAEIIKTRITTNKENADAADPVNPVDENLYGVKKFYGADKCL